MTHVDKTYLINWSIVYCFNKTVRSSKILFLPRPQFAWVTRNNADIDWQWSWLKRVLVIVADLFKMKGYHKFENEPDLVLRQGLLLTKNQAYRFSCWCSRTCYSKSLDSYSLLKSMIFLLSPDQQWSIPFCYLVG